MSFILYLLALSFLPVSEVSATMADTSASYQTAYLYFLPDYGDKEENNKAEIRGCRKIGYAFTRSNCAVPRILKGKCPTGNAYKECYCAGSPTCTGSASSVSPYPSSTGASSTNCKNCAGNTLYTWTCSASSCSVYTLSSCPANGNCSQCCNGKYKLDSCASGYELSGGSCVCATTCADTVTSKPANSSYTTSSCTACGVTTTIKTGWSCDYGYKKSGSSCVEECNSSSSNWCPVHSSCHVNCCTDGTIEPCDTRCGGSGCNTNNSDNDNSGGDNSGDDNNSSSGEYCSYSVVCREGGGTWLGNNRCSIHCYIYAYTWSNYHCVQNGSSWVISYTQHGYCFDDTTTSLYKDLGANERTGRSYSSQSECETAAAAAERDNSNDLEDQASSYPACARYRGYYLTDRYCKNW